jgi:hypothetical protein
MSALEAFDRHMSSRRRRGMSARLMGELSHLFKVESKRTLDSRERRRLWIVSQILATQAERARDGIAVSKVG